MWNVPAGGEASLTGSSAPKVALTIMESDIFESLGINSIRKFQRQGYVARGARTLGREDQSGSEWKYIWIRRTALFLEETLYRGTKWVVFEPNDEPLWAQIRLRIHSFMFGLYRQGGFSVDETGRGVFRQMRYGDND